MRYTQIHLCGLALLSERHKQQKAIDKASDDERSEKIAAGDAIEIAGAAYYRIA